MDRQSIAVTTVRTAVVYVKEDQWGIAIDLQSKRELQVTQEKLRGLEQVYAQSLAILGSVREEIVFEEGGEAHVVLMSPRVLEQRRQARDQLFVLMDQIRGRNPMLDADTVLSDLETPDQSKRAIP